MNGNRSEELTLQRQLYRRPVQSVQLSPVSFDELVQRLEEGRVLCAGHDADLANAVALSVWVSESLNVVLRSNANPIPGEARDVLLAELLSRRVQAGSLLAVAESSAQVLSEAKDEAVRSASAALLPVSDRQVLFLADWSKWSSASFLVRLLARTFSTDALWSAGEMSVVTGPEWLHSFLSREASPLVVSERAYALPSLEQLLPVVESLCAAGMSLSDAVSVLASGE